MRPRNRPKATNRSLTMKTFMEIVFGVVVAESLSRYSDLILFPQKSLTAFISLVASLITIIMFSWVAFMDVVGLLPVQG